jgi:hypothetical protein
MNALPFRDDRPALEALAPLIDSHGRLRVLLAALRLALRRREGPQRRFPAALSDHLRRDIGLPELPPPAGRWLH